MAVFKGNSKEDLNEDENKENEDNNLNKNETNENKPNEEINQPLFEPKIPEKQSWKDFFYNEEDKTIMNKTGPAWLKLIIFYICFYTSLAVFFTIYQRIWFMKLDSDFPYYNHMIQPGVTFQPSINDSGKDIVYSRKSMCSIEPLTDKIDEFLEQYSSLIDLNETEGCTQDNYYGYKIGKPCIFLKLNKIFGFKPQYYKNPINDMPGKLKDYINGLPPNDRDKIWVSCEGRHDESKKYIGDIIYYPGPEFSKADLSNLKGEAFKKYLIPPIVLQLTGPTLKKHILIICRIWAENIEYKEHENSIGNIYFDVTIN